MARQLNQLPPEMILEICSNIRHVPSLKALSLIDKTLRPIADEFLFYKFRVWIDDWKSNNCANMIKPLRSRIIPRIRVFNNRLQAQ